MPSLSHKLRPCVRLIISVREDSAAHRTSTWILRHAQVVCLHFNCLLPVCPNAACLAPSQSHVEMCCCSVVGLQLLLMTLRCRCRQHHNLLSHCMPTHCMYNIVCKACTQRLVGMQHTRPLDCHSIAFPQLQQFDMKPPHAHYREKLPAGKGCLKAGLPTSTVPLSCVQYSWEVPEMESALLNPSQQPCRWKRTGISKQKNPPSCDHVSPQTAFSSLFSPRLASGVSRFKRRWGIQNRVRQASDRQRSLQVTRLPASHPAVLHACIILHPCHPSRRSPRRQAAPKTLLKHGMLSQRARDNGAWHVRPQKPALAGGRYSKGSDSPSMASSVSLVPYTAPAIAATASTPVTGFLKSPNSGRSIT